MSGFFFPETPRLFAHRGDNVRWPENTLPAFRSAADLGIGYLELDVWLSRDERIVVHHDENTLRTCGKKAAVPHTSFAKLRELDPGWGFVDASGERPFAGRGIRIPTLEEVLDAFPEMLLTVEIKQDSERLRELLLGLLRERGALDRVLIASHEDSVVQRVREMAPEVPTNFGYSEARELILSAQKGDLSGYVPPGSALQIPPKRGGRILVTPEVIRAAHDLGVEVHVWTVNDPDEARRLLDMGVDGIMSDDAQLLARLRGEKGYGKR